MALSQLTSSDAGVAARDKINAAIQQAALVPNKQDAFDLAALRASVSARAMQTDFLRMQFEARAVQQLVSDRASVADLSTKVGRDEFTQALRFAETMAVLGDDLSARPGDSPLTFTSSLDGGPASSLPDLTDLDPINLAGGVLRVRTAGIVASRRYGSIEPGRNYRARYVVRREAVADPSNDAVRLGIAWYDAGKNLLQGVSAFTVVLDMLDLTAAQGRQEVVRIFSAAGGSGVLVPPENAAYYREFVQVYGGEQSTFVEVIKVDDVTSLALYAPDVSVFGGRLSALESLNTGARLASLESAAGNPNVRTFTTRTSAQNATIQSGVLAVRLLGYATAGDRGEAVYRRVDTQPAHPGKFMSTDGTWWEIATPRLYVEYFGGVAGATVSDAQAARNSQAFLDMVACAKALGYTEAETPPGAFVGSRSPIPAGISAAVWEGYAAFIVYQAANLRIRGNNTLLLMRGTDRTNYAGAIKFWECGDHGLTGTFTIDWQNLPFVQGVVTAFDPTARTIDFDAAWAPTFTDVASGMVYSDLSGAGLDTVFRAYFLTPDNAATTGAPLTRNSGMNYRVSMGTIPFGLGVDLSQITVGAQIVMLHQIYSSDGVSSYHGDRFTCPEGVLRVNSTAGMGVRTIGTRSVVSFPSVEVPLGSGRLLSANADGSHYCSAGVNSQIGGRLFRSGDDACNAYGYVTGVVARVSDSQLDVSLRSPGVRPRKGEYIDILDGNRQRVSTHFVTTVVANGTGYRLTMFPAIPAAVDTSYDVSYATAAQRIEVPSISVGQNRGRGLLLNVVEGVVGSLNANQCSGAAFDLATFGNQEFSFVRTLLIQNLKAIRCNNLPVGNSGPAVIQVMPFKPDGNFLPPGTIQSVSILSAHIEGTNNGAILVGSATKVSIGNLSTKDIALRAQDTYAPGGGFFTTINNTDVTITRAVHQGPTPGNIIAAGSLNSMSLGSVTNVESSYLSFTNVIADNVFGISGNYRRLQSTNALLLETLYSTVASVHQVSAAPGYSAETQWQVRGAVTARFAVLASGSKVLQANGATHLEVDTQGYWLPGADNAQSIGSTSRRIGNLYLGTQPIVGSDAVLKTEPATIPDALLDAWAEIRWCVFQYRDAVDAKGADHARHHTGLIAQQVRDAMLAHGLDPFRYGLIGKDVLLEPETEITLVKRMIRDEDGELAENEFEEPNVVWKDGGETRLSLRYDQCLIVEAAWARRELQGLSSRVAALEARP